MIYIEMWLIQMSRAKRRAIAMNGKVEPITIKNELSVCPGCGYKDGFHTGFERFRKGNV